MRTWFHSHRIRKQRSEAQLLPLQRNDSLDVQEILPARLFQGRVDNAPNAGISRAGSRMSIERYLSAPLEDEPASVPAISAALQLHTSQKGSRAQTVASTAQSPTSSADANSRGPRTFYTTSSPPASTVTSHSNVSKSHRATHQQRRPAVPELPKLQTQIAPAISAASAERPTTSGTISPEQTLSAQIDKLLVTYRDNGLIDYRAKADTELALIQRRAKKLEADMLKFKAGRETLEGSPSSLTDEAALAKMAARPKLAWLLGGESNDTRSIERPKSSGSALLSTTDLPERPSTSGAGPKSPSPTKEIRKSKSFETLEERARREKRAAGIFERKPSRRPKFYCTFCQKRFNNRVEWLRHEQVIHMPEQLWICCPRTGSFPERCPFCTKANPSPSHLAEHNYLSCQEKPLSERTFNREDHFLQHISQVHNVKPGEKPARFTELIEAWKRPLPLKEGDKALHCGFCGKTFATYQNRTLHVAQHFTEGLDMMSWWSGRVNHDLPDPKPSEAMKHDSDQRHRCLYCDRVYESLGVAQKLHPVCAMWSCSFLPGMQYTIYPVGARTDPKALCCYCNEVLVEGVGKVSGAVLKDHLHQHNFRTCNQRLYFSGQRFRQHLQESHKTNYDGTLSAGWTLLLKSSKKTKPAIFQPIEQPAPKRPNMDPAESVSSPGRSPEYHRMNFMDLTGNGMETPRPAKVPPQKLRRKASTLTLPEKLEYDKASSPAPILRAKTVEFPDGGDNSRRCLSRSRGKTAAQSQQHKAGYPVLSLPTDASGSCPRFYRRRLDASQRNRLYIRDEDTGPLSKSSNRLFKKVEGSIFGGLVLHSSMLGAIPARLTNSADIYTLH